jgi:hypothetical protein
MNPSTVPPRNLDLKELARALGGDIVGGQVLAPGPGHSPCDRSLSVRPSPQSPFGFVVFSHAGDNWNHCRDFVLKKLGEPNWCPSDRKPRTHAPAATDEIMSTDLWKRIWRETEPLGRLALDYLESRGLHELPLPDVEHVLRFHPRCPFGPGEKHTSIVAIVRSVITNLPQAIHRTALAPNGRKLGRKMLGPKTGGAVKFWSDDHVSLQLVVGEGLETTLSAATCIEHRGTLLQPAWALGDAGNLAAFPVLAGIECLTILVDNDGTGTGQRAARTCGERWRAAGREAILLTPHNLGTDFNDLARSAS